jgi:hypothetical protein
VPLPALPPDVKMEPVLADEEHQRRLKAVKAIDPIAR